MNLNLNTRREFLQFLGRGTVVAGLAPTLSILTACQTGSKYDHAELRKNLPFAPIEPTYEDDLVLAAGFRQEILIEWDTPINSKGERFGYNNDYIAFLPQTKNSALLWVNHESVQPVLLGTVTSDLKKTKEQVDIERKNVGGSFIKIKKNSKGRWYFPGANDSNFRVDATTKIPFISEKPIAGSKYAIGTLANCAGGYTPWGTILTCEENYDDFFGEYVYKDDGSRERLKGSKFYQWENFYDYSPEHYGWVVEVNPKTKKSKKLTALGRFAHECATVVKAKNGHCVAYMGDDKADECIYKFIADKPGSLETGELFVADFKNGKWISLKRKGNNVLEEKFKDQTEVLVRARDAAKLLGGTPMDRPEDIERDPVTGALYATLTNNKDKNNHHGQIVKIVEAGNDPLAKSFTPSTFLTGGSKNRFSCPDNLVFDKSGGLWLATDISGKNVGKKPYKDFKNNGLFYIPLRGPLAGQSFQVASAPKDAEFTGVCFSDDGKTLFVSVQHPGERTRSLDNLTSHWPKGGDRVPHPAVVALSGPALEALIRS